MDSHNIFRQFIRAVLHELFRSKTLYNILASVILLAVVAWGYLWQEQYISQGAIALAQRTTNAGESDQLQRLQRLYESRSFQEQILADVRPLLPENITSTTQGLDYLQGHGEMRLADNNVARFSFRAASPQTAQDVLALTMDALLAQTQPKQSGALLQQRITQLNTEKNRLSDALKAAEAALREVKASTGSASGRAGERIGALQNALQDVAVNIDAVDAKIEGIRRHLDKEEALHSAAQRLTQLQAQKAKVSASLEETIALYPSSAPEVVSLQQELDNINVEIVNINEQMPLASKESRLSDSLYQQLRQQLTMEELEKESLLSRQASLQRILATESKQADADQFQIAKLTEAQQRVTNLSAELATVTRSVEESMQARRQAKNTEAQLILLDDASLPTSYKGMGFVEFLILGPLLAFGLPFLMAAVIVLGDSRIRTSRQLNAMVPEGVAVMGTIPHYNSPKTLRVFRKAIFGLATWAAFVLIVYFTIGVIGLKG